MLLKGKIPVEGGETEKTLACLDQEFHGRNCNSTRVKDALLIMLPGPDERLMPQLGRLSLSSHLADRLELKPAADGTCIQYRFVYWTPAQLILHGLIATLFVLEYVADGGFQEAWGPVRFGLLAIGLNLIPLLLFSLSIAPIRDLLESEKLR